ncbi:MAG TPA: YlmH/Sll1252 family protein, partial [Negativicutes bacterium]|nr:YlmH/Sll1252 family protein [Negativicutes bacterium]
YKDYEDRVLVNELLEYSKACERGYTLKNTDFLDPRQQKIAAEILNMNPDIGYSFSGGIEASERAVCLVYSGNYEISEEEAPITLLEITWNNSFKKLSHRDFLGSILGCGIKREKVGDIILNEGSAWVACMSDISRFLLYNLNKVGSVSVSVAETEGASKKEEKVKVIASTVASLRLDSIIATGYGVSRAKAVETIKSGKVKVNWEDIESSSKEMKQGDIVSVRGKGRILLEEVAGTTKKDRIRIAIKKYL